MALCYVGIVPPAGGTILPPEIANIKIKDPTRGHTFPRLFFNYEDIESLRKKADTSHVRITAQIKGAAKEILKKPERYLPPSDERRFHASWNERIGNNLCIFALYCLLYPDDKAALTLVHDYMDRLAKYPSWEVQGGEHDEMPMSHSIVGLSTAYDFLYHTLSVEQRKFYFERIRKATARHFERFKMASWGKFHLQNHVLNNCVGLLTGALIVNALDKRAEQWIKLVTAHLNRTTTLISSIVDGSLDEGVPYSTYTSRSLTMFAFFANRHMNLNYYDNYWFRQYFWYLYGTVLPGYKETVGIGDACKTWFYGPESQLVFLDTFILKNGYANWLAFKIKENHERTGALKSSGSQAWTTIHTEFIWYNEQIPERAPGEDGITKLRIFSDWGVVTYGASAPPGSTFLSFKSSYLHGRAINNAVTYNLQPHLIQGWSSLNPGHEHPDQNSFTFWPRGQPFITEGYYGAKFSFTNNVLMFAPSKKQKLCGPPYEGEIGECYKWLTWMSAEAAGLSADIIAAYEDSGYVFISGEAVNAYSPLLRLKSVYRNVFLVTPDVLLVVDNVEKYKDSDVDRFAAFFQTTAGKLRVEKRKGQAHPVAVLDYNKKEFTAVWDVSNNNGTAAMYKAINFPKANDFQYSSSQFLNISGYLKEPLTRIAYLFYGPGPSVSLPKFVQLNDTGYVVSVTVDSTNYQLRVVSQFDNPVSRLNFLGHTGFATVNTDKGETINFGKDTSQPPPVLFDIEELASDPSSTSENGECSRKSIVYLSLLASVVALVCVILCCHRRIHYYWTTATVLVVLVFISIGRLELMLASCNADTIVVQVVHHHSSTVDPGSKLPSVFISSLKQAGAEMVGSLFNKTTDFLYLSIPNDVAIKQFSDADPHIIDPCIWSINDAYDNVYADWYRRLYWEPYKAVEAFHNDAESVVSANALNYMSSKAEKYPDARLALVSVNGFWNLKLSWMQEAFGTSSRIIYTVRDPRSWIAYMISSKQHKDIFNALKTVFSGNPCASQGTFHPVYMQLKRLVIQEDFDNPVKVLAHLWYADTSATLDILAGTNDYLTVKVEDLVAQPENTAEMMFAFVGMPFSTAARHYVLQMTRSNDFKLPFNEQLRPTNLNFWQNVLTSDDIETIESIASSVMSKLGYDTMSIPSNSL